MPLKTLTPKYNTPPSFCFCYRLTIINFSQGDNGGYPLHFYFIKNEFNKVKYLLIIETKYKIIEIKINGV